MKRQILLIIAISLAFSAFGQRIAEDTYWFYFSNKDNNGYTIDQPLEFLSQRSVDRRAWQSLPIDPGDLPITKQYSDSLIRLGLNIIHTSRWLNGVLVRSTDKQLIDTLHLLSFIDTVHWNKPSGNYYPRGTPAGERFDLPLSSPPLYRYGYAEEQIQQLKLDFLHERGYTGSGVLLAILDAGFANLTTLPSFQSALLDGRILATRNFVEKEKDIYNSHSHGTNVASIVVANWPDSLMGSSPDVELILAITEDVRSETRIEEYAWIEAAEWADSLGADILNTSLGYTTFDDPSTNYSYRDMDGKTASASIANSMTAAKGMVSVTSAGNSGDEDWFYVGAPGDASDILTVGAANSIGVIAPFSSRGPTYDHRIKPEVSAMGVLTAMQSVNGKIALGNGTSLSSPLIAGAAAVLWQAYPTLTSKELMRWIIESADKAGRPDIEYGYGIPNFKKAFQIITGIFPSIGQENIKVYPNPFTDYIHIEIPFDHAGYYNLDIHDIQGRLIFSTRMMTPGKTYLPQNIIPGLYFINIHDSNRSFRSRIIKL